LTGNCRIGDLDIPLNGKGQINSRGDQVQYICDSGYKIQGKSIATCSNSKWSVSSSVKCIGKQKKFEKYEKHYHPVAMGFFLTCSKNSQTKIPFVFRHAEVSTFCSFRYIL